MILTKRSTMLCMTAILSVGLAACGKGGDATGNASSPAAGAGASGSTATAAAVKAATLADGPDVCFRAIAKHLGPNTKVSEITSFFSSGEEIDGNSSKPQGEMTSCSVQYQNPQDPRKLLETRIDGSTGQFGEASPVEIQVMGGDASKFNLEDHLIALSAVDAAALGAIMETEKAKLGGAYSRYAFSGVRLMSPNSFNDKHMLRLDVTGRLASNDIKKSGYATVSTDGKQIATNNLLP